MCSFVILHFEKRFISVIISIYKFYDQINIEKRAIHKMYKAGSIVLKKELRETYLKIFDGKSIIFILQQKGDFNSYFIVPKEVFE